MKKALVALLTAMVVGVLVTPSAAEPPGKFNPWYWTGDIPSDVNRYTVFDQLNSSLIGSQLTNQEAGTSCLDQGPGCTFDAMPALSGDYVLGECESMADIACVHGISVLDSSGKRTAAKFSYFFQSPWERHPMRNQPESERYGLPKGQMASIWQIPGVVHSGGNDLYVLKFVLNWLGCRSASWGCVEGEVDYRRVSFNLIPFSLYKFSGFQNGGTLPANNQHDGMAAVIESFPEDITITVTANVPSSIGKWVKIRASDVSVETNQAGEKSTLVSITGKPVLVPGVSVEREPIKDPWGNSNSPGNWIGVGNDHMWYLEPIRQAANDRASGEIRLFGFETVEPGYATGFNYTACLKDSNAFGGFVASNSMFYSSGAPTLENGTLTYSVGGMHYLSNGQVARGNYEMHIRKSVAACINNQQQVSPYASISVFNEQGQEEVATTVVNTTGDWVSLRAANFTFSQKTIKVDLTRKTPATLTKSPAATIRAQGTRSVRVSISNPVGAGRLEVFLNGKRAASFTISSPRDKRLTNGRIVRTLNLKAKWNNLVVVKLNGTTIQQASFRR